MTGDRWAGTRVTVECTRGDLDLIRLALDTWIERLRGVGHAEDDIAELERLQEKVTAVMDAPIENGGHHGDDG